jgi:hypothetical protein
MKTQRGKLCWVSILTLIFSTIWTSELSALRAGSVLLPRKFLGTLRLKCDGTRAETRFRLSAKRTSPFQSAGASVQSTTGNRGVRICGSNAGYTTFRGSVKSTGYPLHLPVSPSLPLPCVTVFHHISTGLYLFLLEVYWTPGTVHPSRRKGD